MSINDPRIKGGKDLQIVRVKSYKANGDENVDKDNNPVVRTIEADKPAQSNTVTLDGSLTATGAVLGTFTDTTPYNVLMLNARTVGTSVDVTVSMDGTNYSANVTLMDVETGAPFATPEITATGVYKLSGKYKSVKLTAVGACVVDYLFGVE